MPIHLIVDRGDTFGLAQLYQLRGRVGRGASRAYAYFFHHRKKRPTPEGLERLETIAENTQLGAGYSIAMRDLEMRGAGDLLGKPAAWDRSRRSDFTYIPDYYPKP